jgi:putative membrane protein
VFDVILFTLVGIFIGYFTGIMPGLHPNQVFILLIALLPLVSNYSTGALIAFVIAVSISNVMANDIPSIFLSVPDPATVVNVLPGHRLVLQGRGLEALFICLICEVLTLFVAIILLPILLFMIPLVHELLYPYMHFLLLFLTIWMIILERKKKLVCAFLYLLSGIWGLLTLNSILIPSDQALFPALTGMFGIAQLIVSMQTITHLPLQMSVRNVKIKRLKVVILSGLLAGLLAGILPGAGEAQAAIAVAEFTRLDQRGFLGTLAGINMSNLLFSIVSLYSLHKIRSGASAALDEIVYNFGMNELIFSIGIMMFTVGMSGILTWITGKKFLRFLQKINYKFLSKLIIIFTVIIVILLTGVIGLFILFISTCLGLLPLVFGVKRTSNMGYLLVPTILYFAGLNHVVYNLLF